MKIALVVFKKIGAYGGYEVGIRNSMLACLSVGEDARIEFAQDKNDIIKLASSNDIIHISNYKEYASITNAIPRNNILHLHGYHYEVHPEINGIAKKLFLVQREIDVFHASNILYSSKSLMDFYGTNRGKYIYNCYDNRKFYPAKRKGNGIISTINITYSKGVDRLAALGKNNGYVNVIGDTCPDITGKNTKGPYNIKRLGKMSADEVAKQLRRHRIFVHPSRMESCSIAIIEAMACGLPIIASNVGDNKVIVGDAGIIIDEWDNKTVASAVSYIDDSYELLRENAINRATNFTPLKMGFALLNEYARIVKENK